MVLFWLNMSEKTVVDFPARYEGEIALAERSGDLLAERLALGRMPEGAVPNGDVSAVIDAVGELIHLDALEEAGRPISQKRADRAIDGLRTAVRQFSSWPSVPRTLVIAPLAETLEEFEIEWLALDLIMQIPGLDFLSADERLAIEGALRRIVPVQIRISFANGDWAPEFEELLRYLRDVVSEDPDDEELGALLRRGVLFHAVHGREALVTEDRRALAAAEPLPADLMAALEDLCEEAADKEIFSLSLHLVLSDAIAAGLVPDGGDPLHTASAALIALVRRDEPDEDVDVRYLARWAKAAPRRLEALARELDPVFDWMPSDFDGPIEARQQARWRMGSADIQFLPPRWVPSADAPKPPYTEAAARARLRELRDVAWLMVDPFEAVRFVSECFEYGGDAPDEFDVEVLHEILDLWKEERLSDFSELGEEDFLDEEDDLEEESVDDPLGYPTLVTTDGEPLVFATAEYEVAEGREAEVVRRLDVMEELRREQEDGRLRWVWIEARDDGDLIVASLGLVDRLLEVETQSVERAARVGAGLSGTLGDLIVLLDLTTERPTPEMLMQKMARASGSDDSPAVSPEEQRRIVLEHLDRHYRCWPDQEIPALGHVTPREAVQDPELRPRVIELLLDFERRNLSTPEPMRDFDFGFLWKELGLDRDEDF